MNFIEQATEGLRNLYYAKLRSLLALLGVLVGTASVVAMVLGGELATHEALKEFKSLGTDLLAVSINMAGEEHHELIEKEDNLTLPQALSLSKINSTILQVAPYTELFQSVFYEGHAINSMVLGVTDHFANLLHIRLKKGRFVSLLDQYNFYCVIGRDVYDAIKQYSLKEPIGQSLQVGQHIFVIVGVADTWPENSFVYANVNNAIMIPLMASMLLSRYAIINNIIVQLSSEANIAMVEKQIDSHLQAMLLGKQVNFRSAKELIAKMKNQNDILTIFLGLIGSISLIVGGIGVMNIMLVSVMERRREIGIRLAVGAKRRDIGLLFLIEALVLSLLGGLLGVIMGIGIAYAIALFSHWEFAFFWWPPVVGFGVSVAVGIFFGFYPAVLASRLRPIEALKVE